MLSITAAMPMPTPMHSARNMGMRGCFNELGVPDFQWWRDYFQRGVQPNRPPRITPGNGPGWCPRCGYPMLKAHSVCGRCGMARA